LRQISDAFAERRAPALDETGYTWRQPDAAMFHMPKYGRYAGAPRGKVSYMQAFTGILADREILAVIAFVKTRRPNGLRVAQAMLNPGFAGMPAGANTTRWRLPPNCKSVLGGANFGRNHRSSPIWRRRLSPPGDRQCPRHSLCAGRHHPREAMAPANACGGGPAAAS
jgi:hypothetical protein